MVLAARTHVLAPDPPHYVWDNSLAPRLTIQSGDTVVFETRDAGDGHFPPGATTDALLSYEFRGHPLTGPVLVEGARPGDVLQVDVLGVRPAAHGWTAILPGFGLLPEDFPDAYLRT
jgi:acetamidase/formamidase